MRHNGSTPDPTIVIVGAGPRGLSVLGRLRTIRSTKPAPEGRSLTGGIVDPNEPGAGGIWRKGQSGALLMNTVLGPITTFGHEPDEPEEDAGPSFQEWLQASTDPELVELGQDVNGYSPRRIYGGYLADAFRQVLARVPDWIHVQQIQDEAGENEAVGDGGYTGARKDGGARPPRPGGATPRPPRQQP